jgi:nucleoside-diphosphate-sugar epimerase
MNHIHSFSSIPERHALGQDRGLWSKEQQMIQRSPFHLILGDGAVGCCIAQELQARGHSVRLGSPSGRGARCLDAAPHLQVDALDAAQVLAAAQGASHIYVALGLPYSARVWARQWPQVIANAIAAARAVKAKLIHFDNVYAYTHPLQVPMRESDPMEPSTQKGKVRAEVLAQLREAQQDGLPVLVARSADFYGPGTSNSMLTRTVFERHVGGQSAQWIGNPDLLHSFTYVPDAAAATVRLALDTDAYGRAWHLPTADAMSVRALVAISAAQCGAPRDVAVMPRAVFWGLSLVWPLLRELKEMLYQNESSYVFDSSAFMQYAPDFRITALEDGIASSLMWVRQTSAGKLTHPQHSRA